MATTSKTIKVEGLAEAAEGLEELKTATQANVLRRVLLLAAQPIASMARSLAPRGPTGDLILSIDVVPAQPSKMTRTGRSNYDKQSFVEVLVEAGPVVQSVTQEFGTVHHPAHPYMRPAFHSQKLKTIEIIKENLAAEIEKARQRALRKAARIAAKIK